MPAALAVGAIGLCRFEAVCRRVGRGWRDRAPAMLDAFGQHLDLFGGQLASAGDGEGRHQRAGPAIRHDLLELVVGNQGEEQLVIERRRRTELAVGSMTACAIATKQSVEGRLTLRCSPSIRRLGPAGQIASACAAKQNTGQKRPGLRPRIR